MYKGTGPARDCVDCALPPISSRLGILQHHRLSHYSRKQKRRLNLLRTLCLMQEADGSRNISLGIKLLVGYRKVEQLENILPQ